MPVSEATLPHFRKSGPRTRKSGPGSRKCRTGSRKWRAGGTTYHPPTPPTPPQARARLKGGCTGGHCLLVSRICAPHEPPETSQIRDSGSGTKIIRKCTTSWLGCPVGVPGGALSQKTGHFTAPRCLLPHLCGCRAKNETRNTQYELLTSWGYCINTVLPVLSVKGEGGGLWSLVSGRY